MSGKEEASLNSSTLAVESARGGRLLTAAEFQGLADVPPEAEWCANIQNPRTRCAYQIDIREFMAFVGIQARESFGWSPPPM
jgi:hypothetical protein